MILNERQYKIAAKQLRVLSGALETDETADQTPQWLRDAEMSAIRSQLDEITADMREYDLLKSGKTLVTALTDLDHLPLTLIQARIAKGLTQSELAKELGLSEQQIQRYEASSYRGASLSRVIDVARIVGVRIRGDWQTDADVSGDSFFVWQDAERLEWDRFPLKEMIKRNWVKLGHGQSPMSAIRDFFLSTAGSQYATILHRKKFHGAHKPDEYSLIAWQARVLGNAKRQVSAGSIEQFEFRDDWGQRLAHTSRDDDAPLKAQAFLAKMGVILVIEPHLPGTYLDGAAMMIETGSPVVALTLRYDRLDHFWFVLFHELGHVFLHLSNQFGMDFFDEEDDVNSDAIEREADSYALEHLVPTRDWRRCVSRFSISEQTVKSDAERLGVHPSIVAGRIRREQGNYTILNSLIGQNEVRTMFGVNDERE